LLSAAVFLAGLGLCELSFRGWLRWKGEPYDSSAVESYLREAANPIAAYQPRAGPQTPRDDDGKMLGVLHPFCGAEHEPDTGGVLEYFRERATPKDYTVVVVGGSVAAFFAASAGAELKHSLESDPRLAGRTVRVLNYAHSSYKEPQQLTRLAYLLSLGYRPDAVINIDGFNEVALAYENGTLGTNPVYPSAPVWGVVVQDFGSPTSAQLDLMLEMWNLRNKMRDTIDFALRWRVARSSLAGRFASTRVHVLADQRFQIQSRLNEVTAGASRAAAAALQANGPEYKHDTDAILAMCITDWFESSLSIQALCASRGIAYLHVLQPTLHDPGSKPLSRVEQNLPPGPVAWKPGVLMGYPLLRTRANDLASRGVVFLDASRAFASTDETLYIDACHFNPRGNEILERMIAPYFLANLLPAVAGTVPARAAPAQPPTERR
jgi:hypothetical protein